MKRSLAARLGSSFGEGIPTADASRIAGLAAVHGLKVGGGLAATVLWARAMPQEAFGEFRVALAVLSFVSAFCLIGLGQAMLMSAARSKDGNFSRLLWSRLRANAAAMVALAAAAAYFMGDGGMAIGLAVAAVLFTPYNLADLWTAWLNGKGRFKALTAGKAISALAPLSALGIAIALDAREAWVVLAVLMAMIAIENVVMLRHARGGLATTDRDDTIVRFGRHNTWATMFTAFLAIDVILLNHWYSPAEVAIYAIATQFPELAKAMFSAVNQALAPKVYRQSSIRKGWASTRGVFMALCLASFAAAVIGLALIAPVTVWLCSTRYTAAVPHAEWLWLVACATGATTHLGALLLATQKPVFVYAPYLGFPALQGALYVLLAGDGIAGLVLARVVAMGALAAFYVVGFAYCIVHEARDDRN